MHKLFYLIKSNTKVPITATQGPATKLEENIGARLIMFMHTLLSYQLIDDISGTSEQSLVGRYIATRLHSIH